MENAIEVKDLVKRFGSFTAVDHISFNVKKGEIFGFLGANGAGKTTAIRMLCGLSIPTEGGGMVTGCDICTQAEEIKRHIGYMSQKFALYEDLTVRENIELFAGIYGVPDDIIKSRMDKMLRSLHVMEVKDQMVRSLPLGWKQKVAFTAALFHKPELVFLDEPTGGVDPETRRRFWEIIFQVVAYGGVTVFVTTHYMDEAEYCDRVSIMVDGKISELDTPKALMAKYGVGSMAEVFEIVARGAKNSE